MSEKFREHMKLLQDELNTCAGEGRKLSCVSALLVIAAVIPALTWLILYFWKPNFVKGKMRMVIWY